jgi:branched-chain amino acid transport system substrate-binding protein
MKNRWSAAGSVTSVGGPVIALVGACLLFAGCGSMVAHAKIVAAAGGSGSSVLGPGGSVGAPGSPGSGQGASITGLNPAGSETVGQAAGPSSPTPTSSVVSGNNAGLSSSATGGGGSGASTDHSPIVIGSVGNYSGIVGGSEAPGVVALQAWTSWVNAHGGVNGHPIKLYVRDDQTDPAQNLTDTQALVEQQHIVAEVSAWASLTQQASASYLSQHGIPVIGGDGTGQGSWGQLSNFFPEGDIMDTLIENAPAAGAKVLFPQGKKKLAILACQEAQICTEGAAADTKYAPSLGWDIVYNQSASFAAPNYTAQCLQMHNAQADAVILLMPPSASLNIAQSCDQQGYDPYYLLNYGTVEGNFNTIPALRNTIVPSAAFPFAGGPVTPPVAEYYQAMRQYEPNQILDPATSAGWAAAMMFQAAVERIAGPVTSASLMSAMRAFSGDTFGGLTAPLTFTKPPVNPPRCWFLMMIQNGQWVAPAGDTPQCQA